MRILVVEHDDVLQEGPKIGLELKELAADIVGRCDDADTPAEDRDPD